MRKFTAGLLAMLVASAFTTPTVNAAVVKMVTRQAAQKAPAKKAAATAPNSRSAKTASKTAEKGKSTAKETKQKTAQAKTADKGRNGKTAEKTVSSKYAKGKEATSSRYASKVASTKGTSAKASSARTQTVAAYTAPKKTVSTYKPSYSTYTSSRTYSDGALPAYTTSGAISSASPQAGSQSAAITPPISSFGKPKAPANLDAQSNVSKPAQQSIYVGETPNGPNTRAKAVLVLDESDLKILYERNSTARMPIASITKLMTAYIVVESRQDMNEILEITDEDLDYLKGTSSRLRVGTRLTRGEMLHLALMSSENRAASALGRYYPGGKPAFIKAMNVTAAMLGMTNTHYVDSNGLSPQNVSCARDLAKLVMAASEHPLIRKYSTAEYHTIYDGEKTLNYGSSNRLTHSSDWKIQVQKTGYIREAGQCLAMKTTIDNKPIVMILLNVVGPKGARIVDAQHIKNWLTHTEDSDSTFGSLFSGRGRSPSSDDSDFYN